jgi:hypothetical protein
MAFEHDGREMAWIPIHGLLPRQVRTELIADPACILGWFEN